MPDGKSPQEIGALETAKAPTTPNESSGGTHPQRGIPEAGERIGRFTVLQTLGRGGMGVVVSAYDPRLDRRVALKLVSARSEVASGGHRDRLLREARAMARLRHPNVVGVHEVGEHEGQVYLAMEQVEGGTLRHALAEAEREGRGDWRRIVDLFVQAGRGLAAAHAAGMVHRDFKLDNVFVDGSGRVLVGDFGLVGALQSAPSDADERVSLREPFTYGDAIVGTPAYMAPEQHMAAAVDARADQFAFCVALYEALYGELPFAGETRGEYLSAIRRGGVKPPAPTRKLPAWLRETLLRGLAADPEARFSSMDELLAELGADPQGVWRLGQRTRAILVAVSVAFGAVWLGAYVGFGLEFTYELHYITSIGFFLVLLGVGWFGRRSFTRTAFDRTTLGAGLGTALMGVLLAVGGHQLGIPSDTLAILYLLVFGVAFLIGAVTFDSRLGVAAASYVIGFLLAAAWPPSFLVAIVFAHTVGLINFLFVVTAPGRLAP